MENIQLKIAIPRGKAPPSILRLLPVQCRTKQSFIDWTALQRRTLAGYPFAPSGEFQICERDSTSAANLYRNALDTGTGSVTKTRPRHTPDKCSLQLQI